MANYEVGDPGRFYPGGWDTRSDVMIASMNRYSPQLFDNVTTAIPLLKRFKEGGRIKIENGGKLIEEDLLIGLQGNTNTKWFWLDDTFKLGVHNVLSKALYAWKQMVSTTQIAGSEERQNMGDKTKKFSIIENRIKAMEIDFMERMSESMYFSFGGTSTGHPHAYFDEYDTETVPYTVGDVGPDGVQPQDENSDIYKMNGLDMLISTNPTLGKVGGIDRAVAANWWWRNQVLDFSLPPFSVPQGTKGTQSNPASAIRGGDPTDEEFLVAMANFKRKLTRNGDKTTIIIMGDYFYSLYERAIRRTKYIVSNGGEKADSETGTLTFDRIPILWDHNCPNRMAYWLNEKYMKFKVHSGGNFKTLPMRQPYNQDVKIYPMLFMGQMTLQNSHLQGVMTMGTNWVDADNLYPNQPQPSIEDKKKGLDWNIPIKDTGRIISIPGTVNTHAVTAADKAKTDK